jgi:hypothetical protein
MTKKAALLDLVRRHGLREDTSRELLKRADHEHSVRFHVKYAGGYPFPAFEASQAYDSSTGMLTQTPETTVTDMPENAALDDETIQAAMEAAQLGKKEFFDTSVISGLAKIRNLEDKIAEYSTDLMKGMDRVGRLLFFYWWRTDELIDQYGKDDILELEDSLRDVFKSLGDLILFLRRRTIEEPEEAIEA